MPQFLEDKLRQEYGNNDHAIYGTMNAIGAMHGSKETVKGQRMQRKHDQIPKRMAAGGTVVPNWRSLDEPDPADQQEVSPLVLAALQAQQAQAQPQPPVQPPQAAPTIPPAKPAAEPALDQSDSSLDDAPGASSAVDPSAIPPAASASPAPVDTRQEEASSAADIGQPIPGRQMGQPESIPKRTSNVGPIMDDEFTSRAQQALLEDTYKRDKSGQRTNTPQGIPIWRQAVSAALPMLRPMLMNPPNKLDQNLSQAEKIAALKEKAQAAQGNLEARKEQTDAYREWHLLSAEQRADLRRGKPGMAQVLEEAMAAKDRDGNPLYDNEDLKRIGAGWKPPTEVPEKFQAVAPGHPILNTGTGAITPGLGESAKPEKDKQRDDQAIAIRQKLDMGKPITQEEKSFLVAYKKYIDESKVQPGVMRMEMMGEMRDSAVIDKLTGNMEMRSAADIRNNPGRYAPAGQGATAMTKEAVFKDLHYNIDTARNAIKGLDSIDTPTRAALSYALRHSDPASAFQTFLTGAAGTAMNPQQQEAVQALALLAENAMSLRSVAGMGQGSEDLRAAILNTLPSGKSPSKGYALGQLNKFEEVVKRLETGVPRVIGGQGGQPEPTVPSAVQPREQQNRSTGAFRHTLDGGKTWQPGRLPNQ